MRDKGPARRATVAAGSAVSLVTLGLGAHSAVDGSCPTARQIGLTLLVALIGSWYAATRLRTPATRLLAVGLAQPLLHAVMMAPLPVTAASHHPSWRVAAPMVAAHAAAALITLWWFAGGARMAIAPVLGSAGRLLRVFAVPPLDVPARPGALNVRGHTPRLRSSVLVGTGPRRAPPVVVV